MSIATHIHIILTGGTIEKTYDPRTEKPEFKEQSMIPEYLADAVKTYPSLSFERLCQIDSLEMTPAIREDIAAAISRTKAKKIIIVHGTSTMEETGKYLLANRMDNEKTIILTGAMIPMKEFAMSDAGFNLGFAMAEVLNRQPGIYICMNARTFPARSVTKNVSEGRFVSV